MFDHGGVLTAECGTMLDHGVIAVGHGTVVCSQQRAARCLTMASLPLVMPQWCAHHSVGHDA